MVAAIVASPPEIYALDPNKAITQYVQSTWNSEHGLPQNSVHALAQTQNGFLWLGTEEGLARFDGVTFEVFTSHGSNGLASDYVQALAADLDGSLWIGTDSGLTHWVPGRGTSPAEGTFQRIRLSQAPAEDSVTALAIDSSGTLWAGTTQGMRFLRGGQLVQSPYAPRLAELSVRALAAQPDGTLWIGTNKGLFRAAQGHLEQWTKHDGLPGDVVTAVAVTPAAGGDVWVGMSGGGLALVHDGRLSIPAVPLSWKEIDGLLRDRDGALWIAFDRHGFGRLFDGQLSLYDSSSGLPSNRCTRALLEDREGNLWLGLLDAGVVELRDANFTVFGKPEGLAGNYIGNVLQTHDGSVWIGSDSNGLNQLLPNGQVNIWGHKQGLPDSAVYSLLETRDRSLLIGYRSGALARLRNGQVTVYHDPAAADASLNSLFQDRDGNVWAGFYGKGVARIKDGRFEHVRLTGRIPGIAQTPDGALWFAEDGGGVERWSRGQWTRFTVANGLPSDHVMCIYADNAGDVWLGTASGGLSRIRGDRIVNWTVDQGLPGTTIGSIVEDDEGYLWLGGDSGIARQSKAELNEGLQRLNPALFTVVNGLRSRETVYGGMPSSWKGLDGKLWFATVLGAASVDPGKLHLNPVSPSVLIESVTFDGRRIEGVGKLTLGAGSGNLHVIYTAPSFVAPARVQFLYRLKGFDKDWVAAGSRREAWYTNLPPGKYSFEVRAANSDGVWSTKDASLELELRPPLSRTPLAFVCYLLTVSGVVWLIVLLRTRRLIRNREELNRIVADRTAQLEAEKAALEEARRELHTQATHDSLTGLFNRGAILEHLDRELSRAAREKTALGVIIADLDHFKRLNDTFGHLAGDEVIRETGRRLRQATRTYDLVGRYGGEEFLILLPLWDPELAPGRIDLLLESIRSTPFALDAQEVQVTCSFGVTSFQPGTPITAKGLLSSADRALYVAKNAGRDRASIADANPDTPNESIKIGLGALTDSSRPVHSGAD